MPDEISIAIETSCRHGGLALGCNDTLVRTETFDTMGRHASRLVSRLQQLAADAGVSPSGIDHVYISIGPGSFTGLRVGVTVARTLAQASGARCVAVPTAQAVAWNVRDVTWQNLAVVADARQDEIYVSLLKRDGDQISAAAPAELTTPEAFLAAAPQPLLLIGEGLAYHDLTARGDDVADDTCHLPTVAGIWHVGRKMATAGNFTEYHHLLPIYSRKPACEA